MINGTTCEPIVIQTISGDLSVATYVKAWSYFAVHPTVYGWDNSFASCSEEQQFTITHIPTGLNIGHYPTLFHAARAADWLESLQVNWNCDIKEAKEQSRELEFSIWDALREKFREGERQ